MKAAGLAAGPLSACGTPDPLAGFQTGERGREMRLYDAGLTRGRQDRALTHAVAKDALGPRLRLNLQLARRGAARARVYPDTALGAAPLGEAEDGACARALLSSRARLKVGPIAQEVCALPTGARVEARGWLTRGTLEATHPLNVRELERQKSAQRAGRTRDLRACLTLRPRSSGAGRRAPR